MDEIAVFLYGMLIGSFLGFAFAIALDEIRLLRIMKLRENERNKKEKQKNGRSNKV